MDILRSVLHARTGKMRNECVKVFCGAKGLNEKKLVLIWFSNMEKRMIASLSGYWKLMAERQVDCISSD